MLPKRPALTNTRFGSMPSKGPKIRHAPVCLVWDDVVYRLDIGPERARGRNSVIEELWSATPDRREIGSNSSAPPSMKGSSEPPA